MARYDLDKDQRLSYSDYLEMITPFENEYVNLLNSRQAKNGNMEHTYYELYSPLTKDDIKNFWLFLIDTERKLSLLRSGMPQTKASLKKLFEKIDIRRKGSVSRTEFNRFLHQNDTPVSGRELAF